MDIYNHYSNLYWQKGYVTIPCNGKLPVTQGWQEWTADVEEQRAKINQFNKNYPKLNIGLPLGKVNRLVALDIDIEDPKLFNEVVADILHQMILQKTGKKGVTCFFEFLGQMARKSERYIHPETLKTVGLELLAEGNQTILPPSIHPETKNPYSWIGDPLESKNFDDLDLPAFTDYDFELLCQRFYFLCKSYGYIPDKEYRKNMKGKQGAGKPSGRNDKLKSAVVAMAANKKDTITILKEIFELDQKLYGEHSLFNDKSEKLKGKTPQEKCENFVFSILDSIKDHDLKPNEENTFDTGFFYEIVTEKGDIIYKPDYIGCAKYFKNELNYICSNSWVYKYNGKKYDRVDDLEFKAQIYNLINKRPTKEKPASQLNKNFKDQIMAHCAYNDLEFNSCESKINLANGILDIKKRTLLSHSPKYFFKSMSNIEFDPKAKCNKWINFLNEVFESEPTSIDLLAEAFGYTLLGGPPFLHKAFCLFGTGRNGKSTILNILTALLSQENVTAVPLSKLDKPFSMILMQNAQANIVGEIPRNSISSEAFKGIVAGDSQLASYKNKDEFVFQPTVRLWIAANEMPRFNESTKGLHSRIEYMALNKVFEESNANKFLSQELIETEMKGVLNWALEGLDRLMARGYLMKTKMSEALKHDHMLEANSIYSFIVTCFDLRSPDLDWDVVEPIKLSDLYPFYLKFCEKERNDPIKLKVFSRKMKEQLRDLYAERGCYESGGFWKTKILRKNDAKLKELMFEDLGFFHSRSYSND